MRWGESAIPGQVGQRIEVPDLPGTAPAIRAIFWVDGNLPGHRVEHYVGRRGHQVEIEAPGADPQRAPVNILRTVEGAGAAGG